MTIFITGMGMITPLGEGVESNWRSLMDAKSGIKGITRFDPSGFPVRFAAECPNVDPLPIDNQSPFIARQLATLKGRLTAIALQEALTMANVDLSGPRVGICLGSEAARPDLALLANRKKEGKSPDLADLDALSPDAPVKLIQFMTGATGPTSVVSTACTSSSQAIGEGLLQLRRGEVDAMIVGGVDVLVDPLMVTGFSLLGALSTRNDDPEAASRPFDSQRDGFVLGEGAGFIVLENEKRLGGREPIGRLSGYGCSCNAYRITDSPPDGRGAAQSMRSALYDAGLRPESIGYINAHGTSTKMNDASETRGILSAFGQVGSRVPVSSTKSMMGHLVAACGAVEAIVSMLAVRNGYLPPTRNLDSVDPDCVLNHIPHEPIQSDIEHAMTNAFGFGGSNGTLVVSRC